MEGEELGGEKRGVRGNMADAAAEVEERGVSQTAKDLFAGAAGGIAQVLLGKFISNFFTKEASGRMSRASWDPIRSRALCYLGSNYNVAFNSIYVLGQGFFYYSKSHFFSQ